MKKNPEPGVGKLSVLGVLLAKVERPPRKPGQEDEEYNQPMAQEYLNKVADSFTKEMDDGICVSYDNIEFQFNIIRWCSGGKRRSSNCFTGIILGPSKRSYRVWMEF